VRVATLFKRLLRLGRERVVRVSLVEGAGDQVLVELARPARRRMRCPHCGFQTRATYDRAVRSWRHLDVLRARCLVRCEVRRIDCPTCGVVPEEIPWARPGSRFTRAFEDGCVWLSRDAPKSVVAQLMRVDWATVGRMIERVVAEYPNFAVVATTLRNAKTATVNDWGAICYCDGRLYQSKTRENLEIFDRVGGGDSFASGLIYGLLMSKGPEWAVECGAAHGALAMTTPGDTSMATLAEVEKAMKGGGARVDR